MPFAKGKSGNPGGQKSQLNKGVIAARKHAERAIQVLAEALESPDENVKVKAAQSILDRAWGKAKEHVELTGENGGPITTASLPATDIFLATMLAAGAQTSPSDTLPN